MEKQLIINLGIKILKKFNEQDFIIYVCSTKTKLKDYKDYISAYEYNFIQELWKNKKFISGINELKGGKI
jgi:hypothetical protein